MRKVAAVIKRLTLVSRPLGWPGTVGLYAAGLLVSHTSFTSWAAIVGALFFTIPMGIIIYAPNDIADRESDALNSRKGSSGQGVIASSSETRMLMVAVVVTMAVFVVLYTFTERYWEAFSVLGLLLFSYAYSVKPLRLKTRPLLDSISNGFWVLCSFLCGYFINYQGLSATFPHLSTLATLVLASIAGHAWTTVVDYEADVKVGDTTTAVALGKRPTIGLSLALFIACFFITSSLPVRAYIGYCIVATAISFLYPISRLMYWLAFGAVMLIPIMVGYIALFGL